MNRGRVGSMRTRGHNEWTLSNILRLNMYASRID